MICHPSHQKPAGPIVAAKHEDSGKNCEKPDEANPKDIISKWRRRLELGGMVGKSDGASGNEQPTDDNDWERTFLHPIMILASASTRFALISQRKAEYYHVVNPVQVLTRPGLGFVQKQIEAQFKQNAPRPDPLPSDGRGNSLIRLLHFLQRLDTPTD